jgi:hypothetical protein
MANIGNRELDDAALHIAGLYQSALKIKAEPVLPDTGPVKGAVVAQIVADLAEGKVPDGPFSAQQKQALAGQSKSRLSNDLKSFGPVASVELIEYQNTDAGARYTFRISYKDFTLLVDCAANPQGTITKFNIHD